MLFCNFVKIRITAKETQLAVYLLSKSIPNQLPIQQIILYYFKSFCFHSSIFTGHSNLLNSLPLQNTMSYYAPISKKKLIKTQTQKRNHPNPIYDIKEVEEDFEPLSKIIQQMERKEDRYNNYDQSVSSEVCWDQSSRKNVSLKRISIVNGTKHIENISIPTIINQTLDRSFDDLYNMFGDL
ncbi:Hypothetical_protein [Hexamita inflata]|uniref:Hypothetical_protein n=1 Tax=Hexamita inflata TaxID=28002 RepID=A0AA86PQD5_9EUKA|nr:Hypothetical protein HINF_LOCUS32075 [Hexamita inflata]